MPGILKGYNYDIFISYRQKDNKQGGWVTTFVKDLKSELESTFKEELSLYFDINHKDGLLGNYDVEESLKEKLKCLIFIPIVSRTYCDTNSYAWKNELRTFIDQASTDDLGLKIKLANGNVANRVLPVQIHELDEADRRLFEGELRGFIRGIEFIYKEPGVNKPLTPEDDEKKNLNGTRYRIQVNRTANAISEIIQGIKNFDKWTVNGINMLSEGLENNLRDSQAVSAFHGAPEKIQSTGVYGDISKQGIQIFNGHRTSKFKKYIYSILLLLFLVALIFRWSDIVRIIKPGGEKGDEARIHAIQAREYCDNGNLEAARKEVALALKIDPKNSAAWTTLAAVSVREGDLNSAIKQTLEALSADPGNQRAAYNLAYAFDDKHDYHQAVEWYSKAIKIDSTFVEAYSALGHLYNIMNQPADAILILNMAKTKYPDSEYLYLINKNLGIAYFLEAIYDDAINYLELSVKSNPDQPEAYLFLARAYEANGNMNNSINTWQNYINIEPDSVKRKEAEVHLKDITVKHLQEILK
jgi:tetratricopeptide (TPR) repeat protein